MNAAEQIEKQRTDQLTDRLKMDLLNVDFSQISRTSAKIHPEWESLLQLTQLSVTEELGPEFTLSKDISQFSLYMYPTLNFDFVSGILIYNMAGFLLDDWLDKFPSENEKWIQQLRNKNFPGNGKMDKWWQLAIKLCREVMGEIVLTQLLDNWIYSISKADKVNTIYIGHVSLPDKDFLELRCIDAGTSHQFFLVLAGVGKQLTAELAQDPNYLGLNKQVALHTSVINDLYSLRKEIRDDLYRYNYVYVKMMNNNLSAQAATDAIMQEIRDAEKMARVYGDRMKEMNDPQLSLYVDGMYDIIAGNHYWSTFCKRYNDL
ncbi:uncharacterized protein LOC119068493 [Bradysia coprophila]|uniref:uncharacterized protein LOC119068493 n=1 Tax=Bradysia coprophila TaxID=38358 RepID=UPI00187DBBB1|nr:uncharacterized protein LOC119068493 [Bradysia coprophila]